MRTSVSTMGFLAAPTQLVAAASTAVAGVLDGPVRTGCVVAVLPVAVHVATGDVDVPLVCIGLPDAVRLPCSMVVPVLPRAVAGDAVMLGGGRLAVGDVEVAPARWWKPDRPRLRDLRGARHRVSRLRLETAEPVGAVLRGGGSLAGLVPRLLGLGPGLTPAGDDVLAGALVTLRAAADPAAEALAAAIGDCTGRTTTVSAALLTHAARGECIAELAGFLGALDEPGDLGPALAALLAVGATSGQALALGVHRALTEAAT